MRILAAALAVLLLVAICSLAETNLRDPRIAPLFQKKDTKHSCCFAYTGHRVPLRMIRSAYRTSSSCPVPGVVLVTRRVRKLCTDPKARWVPEYLEYLKMLKY